MNEEAKSCEKYINFLVSEHRQAKALADQAKKKENELRDKIISYAKDRASDIERGTSTLELEGITVKVKFDLSVSADIKAISALAKQDDGKDPDLLSALTSARSLVETKPQFNSSRFFKLSYDDQNLILSKIGEHVEIKPKATTVSYKIVE